MMYKWQTQQPERNSQSSGKSWNRRESSTGKVFLFATVVLASLIGTVRPAAAQEQVLTGERGRPLYRAVINMQGMSLAERLHPSTNGMVPHKIVQPPMPLADFGGEGVRTQRFERGMPPEPAGGGAPVAYSMAASPEAAPPPPGLSPPVATGFQGLNDDNTVIPPDTHGAVGPNHVMTTLNSQVRVQDRSGNILSTISLNGFWRAVGNPDAFDPKCLYDPYAQRWMFTACGDARSDKSSLLMAVSQTSDPTGNWYLYRIDGDPGNQSWVDYPSLGFNKDWIVVNANMFAINFLDQLVHPFFGSKVWVFSKADLYANGTGEFTLFHDTSLKGFTLVPAITHDNELSTMYLVQVDNLVNQNGDLFPTYGMGVNRLQISSITGPVGSEVLNLAQAYTPSTDWWWSIDFFFLFGGTGPQMGLPFFGIDLGDTRIQNVVYRNGSLWCTHTIFLPNDEFLFTFFLSAPYHSAVQWWQLTPEGDIQQTGRIEDQLGITSYAYPSIAVNRCDDVLIGYSSFSTNQFASANYSFRYGTDPTNTLRADTLLKAGEGPYFKTFGGFANRWGDYSSTVVDPVNDVDMWTVQEYAATPASTNVFGTNVFFNFDSRWAVWWGKIDVLDGKTNQILFGSGSYTVNEATPGFATISVLNAGGLPGSVEYITSDGTATAGIDYEAAGGTLTFAAGQTETNFTVRILDNAQVNSNKTLYLMLFNPQGGALLGCVATAVLTIEDDETLGQPNIAGEFNFSTYLNFGFPYFATENETTPNAFCGNTFQSIIQPDRNAPGAIVTVVRTNGSTGKVLVDFSTEPGGFATPGVDYYPTNGTLVFDDYQNSASFLVRVLSDSSFFILPNGLKWVRVVLSNPRPHPDEELYRPGAIRPKLGNGAEAGIEIIEINEGFFQGTNVVTAANWFNIERANYRVDEYATPGVPGLRALNIDVTLYPNGGPGNVNLIVSSLRGAQTYITPLYPLIQRSPDPRPKLVLNAGSDHAWALEDQNSSPPNGPDIFSIPQIWPNSVYTDPALFPITNYSDAWSTNITVQFGGGQCRRSVTIWVTNDPMVEFNEEFVVALRGPNSAPLGINSAATVTILADDPPAGSVDREWNPDFADHTFPSRNLTPGANNMVSAVAVQPDGRTVLVGDFDRVNAQPRPHIARMTASGALDTTFTPGGGTDGFISSVLLYPTNSVHAGKILIGGGFTDYNGSERHGIARLLPNGFVDPSFNPGNGANGAVRTMVLQPDDRIIIAGDFTEYNDEVRHGFARLEPNGSLDPSFDAGDGVDGIVWALALNPDGSLLVAGDFLTIDGQSHGRIARLDQFGALDSAFDAGLGADAAIYAMTLQTNGQVLIAGSFVEIDTRPQVRVARLNPDGSLDTSFDPGTGPDDAVFALTLQPDGKLVIGGLFTSYNGTRRVGLARVRSDGTLDTSFMDTAYNQFAGLINEFSFASPNFVNSIALQPDGNIMIGGSFTAIGGNPSTNTPLRNTWTVFTRADKRSRHNIARVIGGVTHGPGNASFDTADYFTDEHAGTAYLKLVRTDGNLGTLEAVSSPKDRLATAGLDYVSNVVATVWPEAYYQTNLLEQYPTNFAPNAVGLIDPLFLEVPLIDDPLREGDEVVDVRFIRPGGSVTLGGEYIPLGGALGRTSSRLTIADNEFDRGVIAFQSANYTVNEGVGTATITLVRTNGSSGSVTVDYFTTTNAISPRAIPGRDYNFKSGKVTFPSGTTVATFTITIIPDTEVEFDENIGLVLTNATGGARLPGGLPTSSTQAALTIIDNDFPHGRINFSSSTYTNAEADGSANIVVTRTGGSSGSVSVRYETSNGTGIDGVDYTRTTGILTWDDGDSSTRIITVPLLADGIVDGPKTIGLRLFDPMVTGVANTNLPGFRSTAALVVLDSDAYGSLAFNQPYFQADENGGVVTITVARTGGIAGMGGCDYTILEGTGRPGVDYVAGSGRLNFAPGQFSATFDVTLLDDSMPDGNKVITLVLSNPSNVTLGTPSEVLLTIVDNESFNEAAGSGDTGFFQASANGPINAMALHPNGDISIAGDFTEVNNVNRRGMARLMTNGVLDTSFDPGVGADDTIRALALQRDGKLLIGGFFTNYVGTNRSRIARINIDGSLDAAFNPGSGADNPIYAIALQPDEKILVGGNFNRFRGTNSAGIVRLNTNGTVDASFRVGAGVNGSVFAVALQSDGKVLIGGDFTNVNGVARAGLARLHRDGAVDLSFNVGGGFNGAVRALLVQADGKIVVGGSFTLANGFVRSFLARLESNGNVDTAFMNGLVGGDNAVYALALQVDGKIVVAGDFSRFNGVSRNRITRLNTDGSTDTSINFGSGANAFVTSLLIQPDRKIILAGGFTSYDDLPRERIARIHGGSLAGAGAITFARGEFLVRENAGEAQVSVKRRGGTAGTVSVNFSTLDGTAIAGVDYVGTNGTLVFPPGETVQGFSVRILDNGLTNEHRIANLLLSGYSGGATSGPQPSARLVILNDESALGFSADTFGVNENAVSGNATITVRRSLATNDTVTVFFATVPGGSATPGVDYIPTNGVITFLPGEISKNFNVRVINDTNIEGNETVLLNLSNPFSDSGTTAFLSLSNATLVVVEDDFGPGELIVERTEVSVREDATNVFLTVIRTNGFTGLVSVRYRTRDGTASGVSDYVGTNAILSFNDGETRKVAGISIVNDNVTEGDETFIVELVSPTGGATIGTPSITTVTIRDNDTNLIVAAGAFLVSESGPVNNVIDPGETVTVALGLRNVGTSTTTNLVATLQPNANVTPVAPTTRSYGMLLAGGSSRFTNFTFTANGAVGTRLIAALALVDGPLNYGIVTFGFTLGGQSTNNLCNANRITINDNTTATPYPSSIVVSNVGGVIQKVVVTLNRFTHDFPDDVDVLLEGPDGQTVMLMSDAGGNLRASGLTLSFDDNVASILPDSGQLTSGTFRPANYAASPTAADTFPAPAPQPIPGGFSPYTNISLSVFAGANPNGVWRLYVVDDANLQNGAISNGWCLTLVSGDPVSTGTDLALTGQDSPDPVVVGAPLTYRWGITNVGFATASGIVFSTIVDPKTTFISASAGSGAPTLVGSNLTHNIGTLAPGAGTFVQMVVQPNFGGFTKTNVATVQAAQTDLNPADNTLQLTTDVVAPSLSILRNGNDVMLAWPASATGFVLQQSDEVTPPNWSDVTTQPAIVGNQKRVTLRAIDSCRNFRLRKL